MDMPKRILVGTDFSTHSTAALDYAVSLAERLGASLTVLHVYELPSYAYPDVAVPVPPEMEREIAKAATHSIHAACERAAKRGVKLEALVVRGSAWAEIDRVADEKKIDLVVLGTRGHGKLAHVSLGSVAEKVVRTSKHPVLVVPAKR